MLAISIVILSIFLILDFATALTNFNDDEKFVSSVKQGVLKAVLIGFLTIALAQ